MRFEELFADLAAQYDAALTADLESEVAERTRSARGRIGLADRFRASQGAPVRVRLVGGHVFEGVVRATGADWVHLRPPAGGDVVVVTEGVLDVVGLRAVGRSEPSPVLARLGLRHVLRGIARDRRRVVLGLVDGATMTGTIEGVGADVFDITEHDADTASPARRGAGDRSARTVRLAATGYIQEQ